MDFKTSSSIVPGSLVNRISRFSWCEHLCRSKAEIVQLQIFEYSNDAIFIIDLTQDRILEADPRACAMLGYTYEGLLSIPSALCILWRWQIFTGGRITGGVGI